MANNITGKMDGTGLRIGIVVSRFNEMINRRLLEGAMDTLVRHGVEEKNITVVHVPGSFEIPLAARQMAESKNYDALICLGTIIRGATSHYQYISAEVVKGISNCSQETGIPVSLGVITCETLEQAIERAGSKQGNRGRDAALSAIEMANLMKEIARANFPAKLKKTNP